MRCTVSSHGEPAIVRNEALQYASGRYLHFLDDDDQDQVNRLIQSSKRWVKRAAGPVVRAGRQPPRLSIEHWNLTSLPGQGLALSGVCLHDMARRWGSPLHIVSADKLRANVAAFLNVPNHWQSGFEVFYSYKSNPVPGVLKCIHECGVGAEVISHYELWLARKLGVPGERIVYNGPAKSPDSIREAIECGVAVINVNHREEIPVVASIARDCGKRARIGLRVSTDYGWSAQFGIPIAGGEALDAYRQALAAPSLEVVGLHSHRGGMLRYEADVVAFVEQVLAFVDVLDAELGWTPSILNFGGSLATPTVDRLREVDQRLNRTFGRRVPSPDADAALSVERYTACLAQATDRHYAQSRREKPRIFLEPGRAMTGNAQLLLASVLTLKAAGERTYAVLDAGINHAESVRNEFHQVLPTNRFAEPHSRLYTLVGPICTPGDTLYPAIYLPELTPGDTLAIMDAGAYFVPFSTSFSFPRPGIVMIDGGQESLLRRAETFDDLVRCDNF